MRVDAFDFDLPQDRIALKPARPRDSARLFEVLADGTHQHHRVFDLPSCLRPGDLLVLNKTSVMPVQLHGTRRRQNVSPLPVSATLVARAENGPMQWSAFAKPAKRLKAGDEIVFHPASENSGQPFSARVTGKADDGLVGLHFAGSADDFAAGLARCGAPPLPPYIASRRAVDEEDRSDYQTIYAEVAGSVAAPTAGLHFTDALLSALSERGVQTAFVTLHVGIGTFLPVKADHIDDHVMHAEWGEVPDETAAAVNAVRAAGGRIVAVGTTSLRLLESAAVEPRVLNAFKGETDIFISPGYRFKAADALMTNFHLPRSTLFMLVSAIHGVEKMKTVYAEAIDRHYRFYSYGDASLLWMPDTVVA